jgi:hypothetical protein
MPWDDGQYEWTGEWDGGGEEDERSKERRRGVRRGGGGRRGGCRNATPVRNAAHVSRRRLLGKWRLRRCGRSVVVSSGIHASRQAAMINPGLLLLLLAVGADRVECTCAVGRLQ